MRAINFDVEFGMLPYVSVPRCSCYIRSECKVELWYWGNLFL